MEELWDLILYNFVGCLIVFARVTGIFTFNPIFGRQNLPMRARVMMSIAITVCMLAAMGGTTHYVPPSIIAFVGVLILEALLGFAFGFFMHLVMTTLLYAGEITDNKMGLMMANVMDPGSGIQAAVFANFYTYLFLIYFFVTNSHIQYIRLFALSYSIIPVGFQVTLNTHEIIYHIIQFFGTSLELALKLAMPILAAGMITEISVGIIMKAVPAIQVFILSIPLKIILGLFMVLSLVRVISWFIDKLFDTMWANLEIIMYRFV
ncbi:MAG: flagellar biosynthetic protein FliR [Oscillospiraceae bacterium]|nr:flagellar biosynthetic protein FliR [Oscillospiraceae bacterium]